MEQANNKYFKGIPLDIPKNILEREIAIKQWAEGNEHLEEAIRQCISNGVTTKASCAGHDGKFDNDPYLSIEITAESRKRIFNILNTVFKNRDAIKRIDIFNSIDKTGTPKSFVAIHAKHKKRNNIFDLIGEGAKTEIDFEECHPIIKGLMRIEQAVKNLRLFFHAFSYQNLGPTKAIVFINNTLKNNNSIYGGSNITHTINPCLNDAQILNMLSKIQTAMGVTPNEELPSWDLRNYNTQPRT